MNRLAVGLGFWASLIAALSLIVFTACFTIIVLTQDAVAWTNTTTYLEEISNHNPIFKYLAQAAMLVFGLSYLMILHSINAMVFTGRKIYSRLGISFGILFVLLISINYFLQLTYVRFGIQSGTEEGLAQWIMFNPNSVSLSLAMLGWTFMFGLSSFFTAFVFQARGIDRTIRNLFLLNGIFCFIGGIGFLAQNIFLINLGVNVGMGGIMTLLTIVLTFYYYQERKYL